MQKADLINKVFTYEFSFHELAITGAKLETVIGYKPGAIPATLTKIIKEILSSAADHCHIQGGFIIKDNLRFNNQTCQLFVENVDFHLHEIIYRQIKSAGSVAIFACTAGQGISDWSKKFMAEGDLTAGYIIDVVGSEVVEAAVDRMQLMLSQQMTAAGLKISNRFSPGYCRWHVSEQHKLFSLLPDNFCSIRLSGAALMHPLKSVSGIIGIGEDVSFNPYVCRVCDVKNCLYRDRKMSLG
ncbi:MAG: hypothetical protein CVU54_07865 [Deltaproteobacteria bacterium HGW-Deltaproteobacteria-12]|jgi:hypothetical protein|nr:MAG: hypothetical protein CVU54_07865 [Deltaproteobacteria bacterium HGW-Deltaproteobacteria-12]